MKRATSLEREADMHELISIHALVKRATKAFIIAYTGLDISIHALVKRATLS